MSEVWRIIGNRLYRVSEANLLLGVHSIDDCAGFSCVVHDPSNHHMRGWPLHWRDDRGLFERECLHGIGHPDPDDLSYHSAIGEREVGVHGCDGCCQIGGTAGSPARVGSPGPGPTSAYAGAVPAPWPPGLPSFGDCE